MVKPVLSADLRDVLTRGATPRQLALMFGFTTLTVEGRMAKVKPNGERNGLPIYRVQDAAPHLMPLPANMVERVIRMNHMGLPPMLKKEFWQGQREQLRVKAEQGDLWRTEKVVEYVGMAFRDIATEIKLMADAVERDTVLTDSQRDTIESLIGSVLRSIQDRIRLSFDGVRDDPGGRDGGSVLEATGNGDDPDPEPDVWEGIDTDPFQGL